MHNSVSYSHVNECQLIQYLEMVFQNIFTIFETQSIIKNETIQNHFTLAQLKVSLQNKLILLK